jgi:hypothetical protein
MVNVILNGRLGNNLFQIATAVTLAQKNNVGYRIFTGDYLTPNGETLYDYLQQFKNKILRKVDINPGFPNSYSNIHEEKNFEFTPITYTSEILLKGFYQSYKYFDTQLVQNLYNIDPETYSYIVGKYGHILNEKVTSINVRRGDYLTTPENHSVCSIDYFKKAIEEIGINEKYLVISEDIEWCKMNFVGNNFYFAENETINTDIYLQTLCENNIISNSTFGWWGAYLNKNSQKKIIIPKTWFGVAKQYQNTKDLCPKEWHTIENHMETKYRALGYYNWWKKRIEYRLSKKL